MSKKYIGEIQNDNFIFPNNDPWEYGVEIIHDINDYSVSGTVTNFVAVVSGANISVTFNYFWVKNNAEVYINDAGQMGVLSVHMMDAATTYYKPWRLVNSITTTGITQSTITSITSFTITPAMMGLTSFTDGIYNFEVRMIGHRAIYPICLSANLTTFPTPPPTPTPTATPTPTPTGPTPTPTPTPTPYPYFSGATLNITDTGWIKYDSPGGQVYFYAGTLGLYTVTPCADCLSFRQGIPYADLANFTIVNCGTLCP
jgi:hypothetical protein